MGQAVVENLDQENINYDAEYIADNIVQEMDNEDWREDLSEEFRPL